MTVPKQIFLAIDRMLKAAERHNFHPWRRRALALAEKWMLARFEMSSGIGAIFPPMVYALMALRCLGYPDDDPQVVRAMTELQALGIEDADTLRVQPCTSPVWDTAIAMNALAEAGLDAAHPALSSSVDWILSKEVRHQGDWSVKRPGLEPGGWYFEYANEFYPDIDDTAMVLLALKKIRSDDPNGAIRRGLNWILNMQCKDGGWGSFDVDNNRSFLCSVPFADHNAMIDPSTADITARVLEMLAKFGYDDSYSQVRRAIDFLLLHQEPDGSWFGRWGVNYIYGTWQVLKGLTTIGVDVDHPSVKRGAEWLVAAQHADGGWGETCLTYHFPEQCTIGPSTASQTAWAIMGLLTSGYLDSPAVRRGIEFLLSTQRPDGTWDEDDWTGTGFPGVFYLKYHLYRHSFPLWALGMYAQTRPHESPIASHQPTVSSRQSQLATHD
jgi:squalene-hopene/tetraprenyl-beta-curcumene cyclase